MIRLIETAEIFETIYEAREAVLRLAKKATKENKISATLLFDAKTYRLKKPLIFDISENPELENIRLSLICENGSAVFTSAFPISSEKIAKEEKYYTYQTEADSDGNYPRFNDLYEGDTRLKLCSSEHFTYAFPFSNENKRDNAENMEGIYIPKEIADRLPDGDLSPMTFTIYVEWEFYVLHVLSVDRTRTKTDENGNTHVLLKTKPNELYDYVTKMNATLQPQNRECFLSNHEIFLKEGEWCYHHTNGLLHFLPRTDMKEKIMIPKLEKLFVFNGMDGVHLKCLTFTGVTDQYLADNGYLSMQANVEKRGIRKIPEAAVLTNHTKGLTIENCEFKELGVNGILMLGISARVHIHDNYFHDVSMSAISIGDPVRAVLDPKNASFDLRIQRNHLLRIAYEFPSAPALDIFRVDGLEITHNTIEKTAYSAISVGWQWENLPYAPGEMINVRDAEIAYNKITDFVQILKDGAAIYVLGANCARTYHRRFNTIHHNFAKNETIRPKVMGYYLDGAASHWTVWDNVISGTNRPLYIQHNQYVPQQFTWHNRAYDIYSTEEVQASNHHPERDTIVGNVCVKPTLEELFETYPKAKEIFDSAGFLGNNIL